MAWWWNARTPIVQMTCDEKVSGLIVLLKPSKWGRGGNEWIWSFGPLISVAVPPLGPPSSLLCSRQRLFNGMIFILCPIYGAYVNKGNECRVCRSELKVTVRDILVSLISRTARARHFWGLGYESCLCQVPPMGANLWAEIALPVCHLPQSCFSV